MIRRALWALLPWDMTVVCSESGSGSVCRPTDSAPLRVGSIPTLGAMQIIELFYHIVNYNKT